MASCCSEAELAAALPVIRAEMSRLRAPGSGDRVFKDECVVSFDSPYSPTGLYVNLVTFQGFGQEHVQSDVARSGGRLYLHLQYEQIPKAQPDASAAGEAVPKHLGINVEGGFIVGSHYDTVKKRALAVWMPATATFMKFPLPCPRIPEFVSNICDAVASHGGMRSQQQVEAWEGEQVFESKYARGLVQLNNGKRISNDPKTWRCEASGDTHNLWLNLSTGYIGGGRRNWDGSGGSGAALQHYIDTGRQFPLCVKLGTITPQGADVWSYAEDEDSMVIDPLLPEHLRHWGIDVVGLEKTEKSTNEIEAELNAKYDWSKIIVEGDTARLAFGPGYVGLRNIGSSCYMNSILQAMFSVPEFRARYYGSYRNAIASLPSRADPSTDLSIQLGKIADALIGDKYCAPAPVASGGDAAAAAESVHNDETLERYVVAPYMFKQIVGKGHREFSSGRQQDASEYFQFLLDVLARCERTAMPRLTGSVNSEPTSALFTYAMEHRVEDASSHRVKYTSGPSDVDNLLELRIPVEVAVPVATAAVDEVEAKRMKMEANASSSDEPALEVPLAACLHDMLAPRLLLRTGETVRDIAEAPATDAVVSIVQPRFKTFPKYLMLKLQRYFIDREWKQRKIDVSVPMPEHLDLSAYLSSGLQPGEVEMPASSSSSSGEELSAPASAGAEIAAREAMETEIAVQLMSMGFEEIMCRRAARAVCPGGDVEAAMNWLLEHIDDGDIRDPLPPLAAPGASAAPPSQDFDEETVAMLMSLGYSTARVTRALRETGGDPERAADWLFSHIEGEDDEMDVDAPPVSSSASTSAPSTSSGRYRLLAVVSHMGRSTDHGHYVCHVRRGEQWVLFNDDVVRICEHAPLTHGFLYLYGPEDM